MKKKLGYTAIAALMLASSPLMAMTDEEINARFEQYEARIKMLEDDLSKANKNSPVYVEDLASSVARVEKKLDAKADSNLKINGFVTAAVTQAHEDVDNFGYSDTANFRGLSKAGVQLTYKLNDRADATIQMVARSADTGSDVWEVNAEWAYLSYMVTDDVTARAGRMRIPFYMYSESLDVGYSYPWVRPPLSVYRSPITAYDGIDVLYNFNLGSVNNRIQVWTGSYADTSDGPAHIPDDLNLEEQYGINLTSTFGDFTARLMAFTIGIDGTTTVQVSSAPVVQATFPVSDNLDYSSAGLQWDNGKFFVITETTDLRSREGLFFTDEKAGYVTFGTRIQDWTPYATYGWSYSTNESDFRGEPVCTSSPTAVALDNKTCSNQSKSISLGLRKELGENLSVKFQWDHYYDFGGTNGNFGFDDYSSRADVTTVPFPTVTTTDGQGWNNADLYTLSLDAVF